MNGEDVYDVTTYPGEDDAVRECPHCNLPYTRCDCDIDESRCWDCLKLLTRCRCPR
jgi:hypothetical protein